MLDILNCNVCKRNITDTGRLYGGLCVNCLEAENKAKDARIKVLEAEVESHEKVVEYQAKRQS